MIENNFGHPYRYSPTINRRYLRQLRGKIRFKQILFFTSFL